MIKKIFNQNQIIQAIERYRKNGEPAEVILSSIKELDFYKHPLEAILVLQWIFESLLKKILENNKIKYSNVISKNLRAYFRCYPNTILDKKKIQDLLNIRNDAQHFGKIRDSRLPMMINAYILAIEFIAREAEIDLNRFIPPSSTEQIKLFAQENQIEIEEPKKSYKRHWIGMVLSVAIYLFYQNYHEINFLTGFKGGTYYKMITELKDNYDDDIVVMDSEGSVDNLIQLGEKKILGYGFVQEDVLRKFDKEAKDGKNSYQKMLKNIYLLKPIVKGEIQILVREDSPMEYFKDLEDKRIAIGAEHSGNAITSQAIYEQLFPHKKMNKKYAFFQESLDALRGDNHTIDAIIVVGGAPLSKLKKLKGVKLLSYKQKRELLGYEIGKIKQNSYKWLNSDKRTLTVRSFLVTNIMDERDISILSILDRLKKSVENHNAPNLHKKWREFSELNCLPPTISDRIIYHPATRMNNYCSE